MIRKIVLVLLLLSLATILAWQEVQRRWHMPLTLPQEGVQLQVRSGESLRSVARRLHTQAILANPQMLTLYARWTGADQNIKQGEYLLSAPLTPAALLQLLQSGQVVQYQVTLPEGVTLQQALAILEDDAILRSDLAGVDDPRMLAMIEPFTHPEGLFFPDTYHFSRGSSDVELLRRAHAKMANVLAEEWEARAADIPYETPYEALIMASIIERETGLPEERAQIAGVFVRRLQRGMRLQTDPTIIYGLGESFDGNLRRRDLTDDANPYNTYRIDGLPPTPIALPGREAIHAALHPDAGTALYFVARGDGGHVFSDTLAEHQKAVRKYQLQRRKDYRSSPEKS